MSAAGTETVLIVDDTPENLAVLGELLQPHYSVRVASSGARALALAAQEPVPDLVLLDIVMPGMDGYEVLAALRADARTREIPVIFVTALGSSEDEERGLAAGAADYIVKPYKASIVLARARLQVTLRATQRRLAEANAALASRARELEQVVENLQAFSYTVSHDLRAPLRAVAGFAGMLEEDEGARLTDEGRKLLERVREGARRMDGMILDILDYSRSGRAEMLPVRVDLGRIAGEVAAELSAVHPGTQVEIGPLPTVLADAAMMRQVIANLAGNAFKFSARAAAPRVAISARRVAGGIELCVEDNGVGFDAAYASRLFKLFSRMHSPGEFPGTGIGLATVKRLVERHGGTVRAETEPGVRTVFTVTLPDAPA